MRLYFNSLQVDLLKKHTGPFLFCFFTVMFLLLMQFLILHIDKLVGKGLPLSVILELIITNQAAMVVLAVPMAVLASTLMAFGKFSELNELTALRASGVSSLEMIKPVLMLGTLMFVFMTWFSNEVVPEANQKARSLFIDIRLKKPGFDLKPNVFYDGIDGYTFLVKDINTETDSLYDVTLYQEAGKNRYRAYITAEKGFLKSENEETLTLFLHSGESTRFINTRRSGNELIERSRFDRYRLSFDLSELSFSRSDPNNRGNSDRTMRAQAMLAVTDSLNKEIDTHIYQEHNFDRALKPFIKGEKRQSSESEQIKSNTERWQPDSSYAPPKSSKYFITSYFTSFHQQNRTHENAIAQFRTYKSSLENVLSNVEWRKKRIAKFLVEVHKKVSIPFACIVFVLIGAPIGILTRKGNIGYAALISAIILTFYWISIIQGEKLADRLFITPLQGMWFSNILLSLIGIYLIIHINTPIKINRLFYGNKK